MSVNRAYPAAVCSALRVGQRDTYRADKEIKRYELTINY
jgi:hypothetical protein